VQSISALLADDEKLELEEEALEVETEELDDEELLTLDKLLEGEEEELALLADEGLLVELEELELLTLDGLLEEEDTELELFADEGLLVELDEELVLLADDILLVELGEELELLAETELELDEELCNATRPNHHHISFLYEAQKREGIPSIRHGRQGWIHCDELGPRVEPGHPPGLVDHCSAHRDQHTAHILLLIGPRQVSLERRVRVACIYCDHPAIHQLFHLQLLRPHDRVRR
jgi:hypothetical protein